jgi:hypothetical protein
MKLLFENYTFDAAAKQITFNTAEEVTLNRVLIITNVTDNVIVYNFADPNKGGTISDNVLTLNYDTTTMSNSDSLQIFLDLNGQAASEDAIVLLRRIVQLLTPSATQDSNNRQRINVETGTIAISSGTVTTVSTTTTLNQLAGVDARFQLVDWARTAYNTGIRNNLTNS